MRIVCMVPSRGRPVILGGMLHSFFYLQSREHDVQFCVAVDEDDRMSVDYTTLLVKNRVIPGLKVTVHNRPGSLGQYLNEMAALNPGDVYTCLADDLVCASQHWDKAIAQVVTENPKGVWWWRTPEERRATYPIISDAWYKAAGTIYTDAFPYWFDDMALREVYLMVTGDEVPFLDGARLNDVPFRTTRMRDLRFWDRYFHLTRPGRCKQARIIAGNLGYTVWHNLQFQPNEHFRSRIDDVEKIQGDASPPTEAYLALKARAEMTLARIGALQMAVAAA